MPIKKKVGTETIFDERGTLRERRGFMEITILEPLTTGAAAKLLGVSTQSVRNMCDRGEMPCTVLPSGHRRITLTDKLLGE